MLSVNIVTYIWAIIIDLAVSSKTFYDCDVLQIQYGTQLRQKEQSSSVFRK